MNYEAEIVDLQRRSIVSEHRIEDLEREMQSNRDVLCAIGAMNQSIDDVKTNFTTFKSDIKIDMKEMRNDIKKINTKPAEVVDRVKAAIISAVAVGIISAILTLILK